MAILDLNRIPYYQQKAPFLRALLNGFFDFRVEEGTSGGIDQFFDIETASGLWLDQLANVFNIYRPWAEMDEFSAFEDIDYYDDEFIHTDGVATSLTDSFFRVLVLVILASSNKTCNIQDITDLFQNLFGGEDQCKVRVAESLMHFDIYLYFADHQNVRVLETILQKNPYLIGHYGGISYTINPRFMEELL